MKIRKKWFNRYFIVGGLFGLLGVIFSMTLPELFCWYKIEYFIERVGSDYEYGIYLTGLGSLILSGNAPSLIILCLTGLIGGIGLISGSMLAIINSRLRSKRIGWISGGLILIGPILLLIDLLIGMSAFLSVIDLTEGSSGGTIFFGHVSYYGDPDSQMVWGLGFGFYLSLIGGLIVLLATPKITLLKNTWHY